MTLSYFAETISVYKYFCNSIPSLLQLTMMMVLEASGHYLQVQSESYVCWDKHSGERSDHMAQDWKGSGRPVRVPTTLPNTAQWFQVIQ